MCIEIHPVTKDCLPAITAIYEHHVLSGLASFEVQAPSLDEMRSRHDKIVGGGYPYLVATEGDMVLGYAYAGPYRPRPAYRYTVEDSIYVAPGHAARGVGRMLLSHLISDCEERGYRQMLAVIGDSDNAASIGLHKACGFTMKCVLDAFGFKFGRWVDSVLMQRPLGLGSGTLPRD